MIQLIALFIPIFLLAVGIEWYVSNKRGNNRYTTGNTMMNIAIGAIDQVGGIVYMLLLYLVMDYVFEHYRLFSITNSWYQYLVGYIAIDFISYWYHRFSHRVNILWAGHITHHSSELYNLSNSFRTSLFQGFNRIIFWALLPLFGFEPIAMIVIFKISGVYEFFLHTEYIPKLGFLEKILITPSAHRVHHGKNDIYIDKNYGSNLVIWDKIFGTYQAETEKVIYGVKANYTDKDPLLAIGAHYAYLAKAIKNTHRISDKIRYIFMPPEWRANASEPEDTTTSNVPSEPGLKYKKYTFFQLFFGSIGFILTLAYQDYLSVWDLILCFSVFLLSICESAKILNGSQDHTNEKNYILRYWIVFLPILFSVIFYKENYLMPLLWYQLIALVYTAVVLEKGKVWGFR